MYDTNLKSSQINCDQNKNVFSTRYWRHCVHVPRSEPRRGDPAHARGRPWSHRRTAKQGGKANNSFLLVELLGVFTDPSSSHSSDTREWRVSSAGPLTGECGQDFTCVGPAPRTNTAGSRELNFRKVPWWMFSVGIKKLNTILLRRKSLWPVESRNYKKTNNLRLYISKLKLPKPSTNNSVAIKALRRSNG